MLKMKTTMALAITLLQAGAAFAAVSPEEARQLGTTLTPTGAEKAGNKDGTIPEWTGGMTMPPAKFQPGSNKRVDPYADEKPRLVITGKDMGAHADKLTEGTKELLKRHATMRVDVYPTHRPVYVPKHIAENTRKNATGTRLTAEGLGTENMLAGYPFPIPKNGNEVMWNHLLNYRGLGFNTKFDTWNVDASGRASLATTGEATYAWPTTDAKRSGVINDTEPFWLLKFNYAAPARRKGEAMIVWDSANPLKQGRRAWLYLPGQRRVRLAPDIAYDTPNPGTAGASTYDDASVFNGAMDRFDFKLVGKKEMIVPYGNYKMTYWAKPAEVATPNHINPDVVRWEQHRVWVVEATLKPGKRHVYSKRVFYIDEDSWVAVASDEYDARGQLYRAGFSFSSFSYDVPAQWVDTQGFYDFNAGVYSVPGLVGEYGGIRYLSELPPDTFWSAEQLAGQGIR
ncbi:DUF1329 domain-containing protein [Paucibacter sp. JuS9]|uniref:DUF1329 domain-containing protein n=1 Tax=Roseateles TaxID=93681 RepID=UPI002FE62133